MPASSMPWVKLWTDFLDDPKIGPQKDSVKLRFIQLVLLAGECDADGALVIADNANVMHDKPMTQADVSWRLRVDIETLAAELNDLIDLGVITNIGGVLTVTNFSERQGRKQSEKREKWRKWQSDHRATKKNVMHDSALTHANVMRQEVEKEKEVEKENKTTDAKASTPKQPNLLFDAIAQVTASNVKLMGKRIGMCASQLQKIGATPDQVLQVAKWYCANDWRGRKGEKLTFATLIEVWEMGVGNTQMPPSANGNGHRPNEPAGFAAIREAMKDPRYQE